MRLAALASRRCLSMSADARADFIFIATRLALSACVRRYPIRRNSRLRAATFRHVSRN
jgi:hypothetical protein